MLVDATLGAHNAVRRSEGQVTIPGAINGRAFAKTIVTSVPIGSDLRSCGVAIN